ncbi:hypothetical protein AKJ57_04600 [candidate division MSBL1 archaeon SCGC-AAA259A05]|uniref:Cyclase n=1 Tax=candidate division MSBL1 archaeon SCGC-AAA259A05 TaxID=1698259 RepID=A0A133U719_9EURY|nr:hypothetical protein AKJ57_04600 [candidate division MSBL1 archaeon SCGC-AAA259A05]
MFTVDPEKYRVIDISYTVMPGESVDRPFAIQKNLLPDGAFRYDILKTHSHVGTHVEVEKHFYEGGKSVAKYPLETFYGPGVLFPVKEKVVTRKTCEERMGDTIEKGDIVVFRNETTDEAEKAVLSPSCAKWLREREIKMLVLDKTMRFGENVEKSREFHDILMSKDVVFVEIVDNLEEISKSRFFVMSLPYKVQRLDSSFCRAIVIEEKD